MNAQNVVKWLKSNVFIVVFIAVMIAGGVALPLVSSGMNAEVKKKVASRTQELSKLEQAIQTQVTTPSGEPIQGGGITDEFLRRYEQVAAVMEADAKAVQTAALAHNRKDRGVLMPEVFPEMPPTMRDVLPERFHQSLLAAYEALLAEVGAGRPPELEGMREILEQTRSTFISQELKKDPEAPALEPEEEQKLKEVLARTRMSKYAEAAEHVGMYVTADQLHVPAWNQQQQPGAIEMFQWQWQLWITQDILRALHQANQVDAKVTRAPVKRVIDMVVLNMPGSAAEQGAGGGGGGAAGMGMGMGGAGGMGGGADGSEGAPAAAGALPDPKMPITPNYGTSLTGRVSNPLYDVIDVQLDLIVETQRMPEVIDALAAYNFMTVTKLSLRPEDPFEAARFGYAYGPNSVSGVSLTLQTVWLREWTMEFMPDAMRTQLGLPARTPPQPAQPAGDEG